MRVMLITMHLWPHIWGGGIKYVFVKQMMTSFKTNGSHVFSNVLDKVIIHTCFTRV